MLTHIQRGDLTVEVELKPIKHLHLSVYPPGGRVRIAAPERMDLETIRVYAISKLGWIREQLRESPREYIERESHYVWGKRYLLQVIEINAPPAIDLSPHHLRLCVRPGTDEKKKQAIMEDWYRRQVREAVSPLIAAWEARLGVQVGRV